MWTRGGVALGLIWLASCAGRSHGDDDVPAAGALGSGAGGASAQAGTGGAGGTKSGSAGSGAGRGAAGGAAGSAAGAAGSTGGDAGATRGGAGTLGGMTGDAGAAPGGAGGSAGHELAPCNSSDGSGCPLDEVCLDDASDACWPASTADCTGYCAARLAPSTCDGISQCTGTVTCPALPAACPIGQVVSIVDECFGPCVPADCCACTNDGDCRLDDASCDIVAGRCVIPAAPEPRCLLPFEAGSCDGAIRVFAFVDGHCDPQTYGGCEGNDNRFSTLEECLRRCEGMPQQSECPPDRSPQLTCLACGAGGGCVQTATVCAKACDTGEDCDQGLTCSQGWCGVNFCV